MTWLHIAHHIATAMLDKLFWLALFGLLTLKAQDAHGWRQGWWIAGALVTGFTIAVFWAAAELVTQDPKEWLR